MTLISVENKTHTMFNGVKSFAVAPELLRVYQAEYLWQVKTVGEVKHYIFEGVNNDRDI